MAFKGTYEIVLFSRAKTGKALHVKGDLGEFAEPIQRRLLIHGLNQKMADRAAGDKTEADRIASALAALAALRAGTWAEKGHAGLGILRGLMGRGLGPKVVIPRLKSEEEGFAFYAKNGGTRAKLERSYAVVMASMNPEGIGD